MPRCRIIKPDFWDDEKLGEISRGARLSFTGLWTYSDDYGVVKNDPHAQHLKNAFCRCRELQLGMPSGENSYRLFDVSPKLAASLIRAHISTKKTELVEANEQARIELANPSLDPSADK